MLDTGKWIPLVCHLCRWMLINQLLLWPVQIFAHFNDFWCFIVIIWPIFGLDFNFMPLFGLYCNYLLTFGVAVNYFIIVVDFCIDPFYTRFLVLCWILYYLPFSGWILFLVFLFKFKLLPYLKVRFVIHPF